MNGSFYGEDFHEKMINSVEEYFSQQFFVYFPNILNSFESEDRRIEISLSHF